MGRQKRHIRTSKRGRKFVAGRGRVKYPSLLKMDMSMVKRLNKMGARHPLDPFKSLPPSHPYTQAMLKKWQTKVDEKLGKISLKEFRKRYIRYEKIQARELKKLKRK